MSEKQDAQELVFVVKELALELGRSPTRMELEAGGKCPGMRYRIDRHFGGQYSVLLQAAGLEPNRQGKAAAKQPRIDNSVFETSLARQLEEHEPPALVARKPWPSIAVISDLHWPFALSRVVEAFLEYVGDVKPEWVILNGDARDFYSHSPFPKSHNLFTPREENELSRKQNQDFWLAVKRGAPAAKCYQLLGNHSARPMKRILDAYPAAEDWIAKALEQEFCFPGVTTIMDPREELILGDIAIFHGYRTQLGAHRDYTLMNCVNGHSHTGGTVFRQLRGQVLWELNSGYAGDPSAKGLTYTPQKITGWTNGWGAVSKLGPQFIPW